MEITLCVIISREISTFSIHSDAVSAFESLLSNGLLRLKTDLVESLCIAFICVSPPFSKFFKVHRPKYYEDKTLKCNGSVTPEVRMYKCLTADFVVDFEGYFRFSTV